MKTSLAIVLAVAALTIGTATVAPISSTASQAGADPTGGAGQSCAHRSRHSQERIVGSKLQIGTPAGLSIGEAGWQSFDYGGPRCGDRSRIG